MIGLRAVRKVLWVMGVVAFLAGVTGERVLAVNPQALPVAEGKAPRAVITTKFGQMELVFFPELAPKHVESFLNLAKKGFYNGTIFHRVIPGFMIQGGDPNTKDPSKRHCKDPRSGECYGMGGPGYNVPAEFNRISHERGIVSMARSGGDINSAGSQFFIVVDKASFLDGQYTVFGEVVSGMEVADKIVSQPRDSKDNPLERIEITVEVK